MPFEGPYEGSSNFSGYKKSARITPYEPRRSTGRLIRQESPEYGLERSASTDNFDETIPTQDLYDTMLGNKQMNQPSAYKTPNPKFSQNRGMSSAGRSRQAKTPYFTPQAKKSFLTGGDYYSAIQDPAMEDDFGEDTYLDEHECWVTVFGFDRSYSSYVLKEFQNYGEVLEHETDAGGNWMHVKYKTRLQAQTALTKSGRKLGGSLMVGVVPFTGNSDGTIGGPSHKKPNRTPARITQTQTAKRRKPLPPYKMEPFGVKALPRQSNSLWSKFMEHVWEV
eukprot:TRINITY_DN16801_c0_g1_i1.p1 TRINITY_DN16801_c0_g1~~TRINITY_DN16801_c0_g1_i1.p1  ORF type:complete len:279 (+),score=42.85 TRINITY_DN16801_c0_g1_i1:113-949(+)